ncbi:MAG: serine/threonine protein kinase [Deltaproteobacteria bacterium]|nr:serine/threonine protein kinase [Deltaproteobacteria bacterium]
MVFWLAVDVESTQPEAPTGEPEGPAEGAVLGGRYRVLGALGEGAMGRVLLAEHTALRKQVAVKLLRRELCEVPELVARFEREAVASARLEHPHVVAARDFGRTEDGRLFLVLDHVPGRSLREALEADGPFPPTRALKVLRELAAALEKARELGVVHRDLKPENVMLTARDGDPDFAMVLDFGIAHLGTPESASGGTNPNLTRAGAVLGTPLYLSPEQVVGDPVDHRADLYALAVVAFELLTGRTPFTDGSAVNLLAQQLSATPPRISEVSALPAAADAVFARALAKSPAARHEGARAFVEDLAAALAAPAVTLELAPPAAAPGTRGAPPRESLEGLYLAAQARVMALPARARGALAAGALAALVLAAVVSRGASRAPALTPVALGPERAVPEAAAARPREAEAFAARFAAWRATPEARGALAATRGEPLRSAVAGLEAQRSARPEDPLPHWALGALYARDRATGALSAERYARAVALEPSLAEDPTLREDALRLALEGRTPEPGMESLLRGPLRGWALGVLVELAGGAPGSRRGRALALLAAEPFASRLDETAALLVALARARTCEERRTHVRALGRVGDARALPALRRIPTGSGCGFLGLGRCNGCLDGYLSEAAAAIRARLPDAATPR